MEKKLYKSFEKSISIAGKFAFFSRLALLETNDTFDSLTWKLGIV